jgi:dienelactone hydrolase
MPMLEGFIHKREHHFAQRDQNRRVRPFSWGVEHLSADVPFSLSFAAGGSNGHVRHISIEGSLPHREFVHRYCEQAVKDSDDFFFVPPTTDYSLNDNLLTFPSSIYSADSANNTVYARFFPVESKGRAVLILPQWNADAEGHIGLCKLLNKFGITALRLSLPYHHERRPAHLERSEHLVCSNVGLTLQSNRQAVLDARRAIDWLQNQGYDKIGIMGTSIGSCVAFLTMAHDKRINVGVFNHASSYFADVVWKGLSTKHVKQGLETDVSLEELRKLWAALSPQTFIARMKHRKQKSLIISGRYDLSFPYDLTQDAISEFHRHKIPVKHVTLPCGHYTLGSFPFNYIDGFLISNFFRKNLRMSDKF